jgi:hypothetical protein
MNADQRFTANHPCPICGGHGGLPQGRGERCWGYRSDDGLYARCTREEFAGNLDREDASGAYVHRLGGECRCGRTHGPAANGNGHRPTMVGKAPGQWREVYDNEHPRRAVRTVRHELREEDGTPVAVHVRTYFDDGSKSPCTWERPGGESGLGGANVADLPFYGLHDLGDPDEVIVVEGEPARDALASIGVPAFGTVTGAKSTPSLDRWRRLLTVPTVYLWPDNDDDGRVHLRKNLAQLRAVGHSDARVIDWKDAPHKGDAADFVAAGGTAADLRDLMKAARPVDDLARLAGEATPAEPAAGLAGNTGGVAEGVGTPTPVGPSLVVEWLSDVTPKPIDWLWPRWLARGKLHLLGGVGGIGKGTIMAEIAAQLSTGTGRLPDGTPAPLTKTLFLLSEDAPDDTLWPRLDVHGADKANIAHIKTVTDEDGSNTMLSLARHVALLEHAVVTNGIGLVVVDALSDFMPGADRNSEGEVRDILTPLADMARRIGVAIVGVMHPGKGNGDLKAFQRLLGASAFGNVARVVWLATESPDGEGRNLLGVDKSNLAIKPKALVWSRAEDAPIIWHGETDLAIGDAFGATSAKPRDDAEGFLRELLAGGSVESSRVEALAKAAGLSWGTVRRAAEALKVAKYRPPGPKNPPWYWKLPNGAPGDDPPDDDPPATVKPHVRHNSGDDEWYTPPAYLAAARAVLGAIDLDPASSAEANQVVQAARFYTIEDDGLTQPWAGRVWLNPPYKQPVIQHFCTRLAHEYTVGTVTEAIVLVNNATETRWFGELFAKSSALCLLRGRVKFWRPDKDSKAPLQGQAVLYLGRNVEAFRAAFGQFGRVTVPTESDELLTPIDTQVRNSTSRTSVRPGGDDLLMPVTGNNSYVCSDYRGSATAPDDHVRDSYTCSGNGRVVQPSSSCATREKPQNDGKMLIPPDGEQHVESADGTAVGNARVDELLSCECIGVSNSSATDKPAATVCVECGCHLPADWPDRYCTEHGGEAEPKPERCFNCGVGLGGDAIGGRCPQCHIVYGHRAVAKGDPTCR